MSDELAAMKVTSTADGYSDGYSDSNGGGGSGGRDWSGKKIIATHLQAKTVRLLSDYWTTKGTFLRMRSDPTFVTNEVTLQHVLQYLEARTDLPKQRFWRNLSLEQKIRASKAFVIKECTVLDKVLESTITFPSLSKKPELFVVLSGEITISSGGASGEDNDSTVVLPGQIFGHVDMFNKYANKPLPELLSFEGQQITTLFADLTKSSILRMSYDDFMEKVIALPAAEQVQEVELSEEEKLCRLIRERAKKALSAKLFSSLLQAEILPLSSNSVGYRYVHTGNIGREIELDAADVANSVYIVIDGGVRFELNKNSKPKTKDLEPQARGTSSKMGPKSGANKAAPSSSQSKDVVVDDWHSGTIACKKRGERPLIVKTKTMPVMSLAEGSFYRLTEDCFDVGLPIRDLGKPQLELSKSLSSLGAIKATLAAKPSNIRASIIVNSSVQQQEPLYRLHMVFERPTQYLCIPFDAFKSATKGLSLANSRDVNKQLRQINSSLKERIANLLPWIKGSIDWNTEKTSRRPVSASADWKRLQHVRPSTLPSESQFINQLGSFHQTGELASSETFRLTEPLFVDGIPEQNTFDEERG